MEENKELLIKDLSARLPYNVVVLNTDTDDSTVSFNCFLSYEMVRNLRNEYDTNTYDFKPYLRPMSSMTEEEKNEIKEITNYSFHTTNDGSIVSNNSYAGAVFTSHYDAFKIVDWLNKNHFDYRGLIEKGLAIEAPEGIY